MGNHQQTHRHRPSKKTARSARPRRLVLEPLEPRVLLSVVAADWIGTSGDWWNPANWDIGAVPNNGGGNTYAVTIDVAGSQVITVAQNTTVDSVTTAETLRFTGGASSVSAQVTNSGAMQVAGTSATLAFSGNVTNTGDLSATAGTLRLSNATAANTGHAIAADGGIVELSSSTISGGLLRATDNASSFVQFRGDVTLNGVTWDDPGAGEFRITGGTARLLGDYAAGLPTGYRLAVQDGGQLVLPGGTYTNDGIIELRRSMGEGRLYLSGDTTLAGSGEVVFSHRAGGWARITGQMA